MKNIVASLAVVSALGHPYAAQAQDKSTYHAEAGLNYSRFETDTSRGNSIGVLGTYYFSALPARPDYPLAEGPFVERAASLSATYERTSQHLDNVETLKQGSGYGAGFVFRRPDMPLYLEATYRHIDFGKFRSASGDEREIDGKWYQLAAGGYVAKTTLLALDWSRTMVRSVITSGTGSGGKSADVDVGLSARHLAQLPNGDYFALIPRIGQSRRQEDGAPTQKNHNASLLGTYYPTRALGLSAGYLYDRGDDTFDAGNTWLAGVKWFVLPAVSLSLDFARFQAKAQNADVDFIMLGTAVRF